MADEAKNDQIDQENANVEKPEQKAEVEQVKEKKVEVDSSKFTEKASQQVNRLFKDLETLAFHGSKSALSDELIEHVVSEIREQSTIAKKQFSSNMTEKDFGDITTHVNKVLKEIKTLGELSNRHAGEYTEEHSEKIFESLRKKINETKKGLKFKDKKDKKFTF